MEEIAERAVRKYAERERPFHVKPEDHYNQHKELGEFLKVYNAAKTDTGRFLIRLLLIAALAWTIFAFGAGIIKVPGQ